MARSNQQVNQGLRRFPTDLSLIIGAVLATILTASFYFLLYGLFRDTYIGHLFADRGWSPYAITLLTIWSYVIYIFKYAALSRQSRYLAGNRILEELATRIDSKNIGQVREHIAERVQENADSRIFGIRQRSLLLHRINNALIAYSDHNYSVDAVREELKISSDIDAIGSEATYAMVKTFIWAIPILGFIGTVIGIGVAVGNFSSSVEAAADLDVIKNSLSGVTSGLSVSFDTTLLALVMSLAVMFVSSGMQKSEEGLLTDIDIYCKSRLLPRFDSSGERAASAAAVDYKLIRLIVGKEVDKSTKELERWREKLTAVGEHITAQVTGGWKRVLGESVSAWRHLSQEADHSIAARRRESDDWLSGIEKKLLAQWNTAFSNSFADVSEIQRKTSELSEQQVAHMQQIDRQLAELAEQGREIQLLNAKLMAGAKAAYASQEKPAAVSRTSSGESPDIPRQSESIGSERGTPEDEPTNTHDKPGFLKRMIDRIAG